MPGVAIKAALQTILQNAFVTASGGDGRLKHVNTQFPRLSEQVGIGDFPKVSLSLFAHDEQVLASGRSTYPFGVKGLTWEAVIHVMNELDDPLTQGDAWDLLLDDIESTLRVNMNLTTAVGSPFAFAKRIKRDTLPPLRDLDRNAYYCNITLIVEEALNA